MSDRVIAVLLATVLTAMMLASIVGHGPWSGLLLFAVSDTHGVHLGDLLFVAAWAVSIAFCRRVWRRGED